MATRTLSRRFLSVFPRLSSETIPCLVRFCHYEVEDSEYIVFREYKIPGLHKEPEKPKKTTEKRRRPTIAPRNEKVTLEDWTNAWPTAETFKYSVVPLPVRQGYVDGTHENLGFIPSKDRNYELMKIPNFLHLTPPHIKKHCRAIKKFCTEFPKQLEGTKESHLKTLFPVEVIESDYCFAGPSLRDERARKITVKVQLSSLKLDDHAKDKIIRLLGPRYNKELNEITITTDSCPTKKQNYDYAMYLLTVLYHESRVTKPWEEDRTVNDMIQYFWNINKSKENIIRLLQRYKESDVSKKLEYLPADTSEEQLLKIKQVEQYKDSLENLMNNGETADNMEKYKQSVLDLLNLKKTSPLKTSVAEENLDAPATT